MPDRLADVGETNIDLAEQPEGLMNFLKKIIGGSAIELLLVFSYILIVNNYIGNVERTINSDGIGYYDHLPSLFIHNDLCRVGFGDADGQLEERIENIGAYVPYKEQLVNKYACGTAVLQLPFFLYAYATTPLNGDINDGYQRPFQRAIFYAAIFYLVFGIYFIKRVLQLYGVRWIVIVLCQIGLVLGTSLTHYANYDAGFSHVYSFAAISCFLYLVKRYFVRGGNSDLVGAMAVLGVVLILRQVNILVLLFIPFLAGSWGILKLRVRELTKKPSVILIALSAFLTVFCIQSFVWFAQVGEFLIYSYQGEGFNFLDPQVMNILFSYHRGLFVYAPILLVSLVALVWLAYKREYYLLISWLAGFCGVTYVLSSWWTWFFGSGFGLRAYVDYYPLFFIPIAIFLSNARKPILLATSAFMLTAVSINIIQTYQFKEFIIDWAWMDKRKYWRVFLKTHDKYKGILCMSDLIPEDHVTTDKFTLPGIKLLAGGPEYEYKIPSSDLSGLDSTTTGQMRVGYQYFESCNAKITFRIDGDVSGKCHYYHSRYLIQFSEKRYNPWQQDWFNFTYGHLELTEPVTLTIQVLPNDQDLTLDSIEVRFLNNVKY